MSTVSAAALRRTLAALPRLDLADLPTPLEELPRLSRALGGPRILVKREDQTGLAMGGNKIREFEYSIAQAVEQNCDVLVHGAAAQSNQSRQTAAVAARLGLKSVIVGRADAHAHLQGNLLLARLFGAEVHLPQPQEQGAFLKAKLEQLRQQGHKPFNTSSDGAIYRSIAYVDGFLELWDQLQQQEIEPDALYLCSGAHTHVGLVVGARALGLQQRIVGISPSPRDDSATASHLARIAADNAAILGLELEFSADDIESYAAFAGPAYGVVTPACQEAIQLTARQEGLLLDPCYTGKTMAALIAHIRQGWWRPDQTVVFIHTGGTPALFAYNQELGLDD
ncbi:MAG: pyridoxal-phosphate dependent enzyme [Candidatus Latescibacteria bacterium]|nr:pyridoxal-phosphate dependent enzyme [Candidatus Latescibacterota bacterium]